MKKIGGIIISCLLLITSIQAQNYQFLNAEGQPLFQKQFNNYDSRGTFWKVKQGTSWGIFSPEKGLIIDCIYEEIKKNEAAKVFAAKKNGKWGVINASGTTLLDFKYDDIKYFSDKIAVVDKDFYWVMINYKGEDLVNGQYEDISYSHDEADNLGLWFKKNGRWLLFSRTGKKLTPQGFSFIGEDGRRLRVVSNGWHKTGVIDTQTGKLVVPLQYDQTKVVNANLIEVAKCQIPYDGFGPSPRAGDYLYGIYSVALQKEVVPCTFDKVSVEQTFIKASIRGSASYYSDQGKTINPSQLKETKGLQTLEGTKAEKEAWIKSLYWEIKPTANDYYVVKNEKYETALINLDQQFIMPFGLYQDITAVNSTTFVVKRPNGYWSIISEEGNLMNQRNISSVEAIQSENTYYPFVFFKGYSDFTVFDLKGKSLTSSIFNVLFPVDNNSTTTAIYRNYSIKKGTITDMEFSKNGDFKLLERPFKGENLVVPFKDENGLFGLKKANGTIVEPAKHKSISIKGKQSPIFIIYNPS